jgi:hypothetical protein
MDKLGFAADRLVIVLDLDDNVWPRRQCDLSAHGGNTCAGVGHAGAATRALHNNQGWTGANVVIVVSLEAS